MSSKNRRVELYSTDKHGDYLGSIDDDYALVQWDGEDTPVMEDRDELVFVPLRENTGPPAIEFEVTGGAPLPNGDARLDLKPRDGSDHVHAQVPYALLRQIMAAAEVNRAHYERAAEKGDGTGRW